MFVWLKRLQRPCRHADDMEFHQYVADIASMNKDRQRALQAVTFGRPGSEQELERLDHMIAIAQEAVLRFSRRRER